MRRSLLAAMAALALAAPAPAGLWGSTTPLGDGPLSDVGAVIDSVAQKGLLPEDRSGWVESPGGDEAARMAWRSAVGSTWTAPDGAELRRAPVMVIATRRIRPADDAEMAALDQPRQGSKAAAAAARTAALARRARVLAVAGGEDLVDAYADFLGRRDEVAAEAAWRRDLSREAVSR